MDRIHVKAPGNWINDPNGFIYYRGKYHLFYQHFPYEPRWGTMHWGHCISSDLVHWQHEKIALFPSKYDDRNGCFSGSAVEADGKLNLFYTGVRYLEEDPDDIHLCRQNRFVSAQMRMVSEDGIHFDNIRNKETVIPVLTDPETGDAAHTRDPKVWRGSDAWYMVLGTTQNEKGKLLIYRSEDLQHWELKNSVKGTGNFGWMWECPDYFEVNGSQILLVSPMGLLKDGNREANQAVCAFVDFQEETCSMNISDRWQFLDYGLDLYAPQSTVDELGQNARAGGGTMDGNALRNPGCGNRKRPSVFPAPSQCDAGLFQRDHLSCGSFGGLLSGMSGAGRRRDGKCGRLSDQGRREPDPYRPAPGVSFSGTLA